MAKPTCRVCHRRNGRHWPGCDRPPAIHRWTKGEIELVARLANDGYSVAQIASVTGWPKGVLHFQCQRHGIKTYWHELQWTKNDDHFLKNQKHRGWKWCAEQMGRTRWAVHARVKKLGIQNKMLSADDLVVVRSLHANGATTTVIGEHLGVTAFCIGCTLKKLGLVANPRDEKKKRESVKKMMAMRLQTEFSLLTGILEGKEKDG